MMLFCEAATNMFDNVRDVMASKVAARRMLWTVLHHGQQL
jgi:hypothetical protein